MKLRRLAAAAAAPSFAAPSLAAAPGAARAYPLAGASTVERLVAPARLPLAVRKGGRVGTVEVALRGNVIPTEPLVVSRRLSHPGSGDRLSFAADRTGHDAWSLT